MKKLFFVVLCLFTFANTVVLADEHTHQEAALKLLEITNARSMVDQMRTSLELMMQKQLEAAAKDLQPEAQEAMGTIQKEIMRWSSENFNWDQIKQMYVEIYIQVFTESEINELVEFYQSPLGKKMLAKMPELMQASMQKTQKFVQSKLPEFQEHMKKLLSELEAKYKK